MNGVQLASGLVLLATSALCGCVHRVKPQEAPLMTIPVKCITQVQYQSASCEPTASPDFAICQNVIIRYECINYNPAKADKAPR